MGVVSKIRKALGMGESTYQYRCSDCGAEFESKQSRMVDPSCPECASTSVERA